MLRAAQRLQQQGHWRQRCLSRAGTAADAKIVAVTVAARAFADAAVQRRGQARRASPPLPKSLADACRDWHRRCLSRVGTAADAKIVAVTVAARFFAVAAVQRRGQSASDSPRCCGQRGGFDSRGTGAKCACPGLGPRRMQRASLSPSPRGFLLTPRSNDGDSQQVTVPPVTALYGVIEEATLPVRRVTRAGRHKKARRCRGEERVGQPVAEPRRQRLAWKLDGVIAPWPTSAEACRRRSFNTTTNPRPQRP